MSNSNVNETAEASSATREIWEFNGPCMNKRLQALDRMVDSMVNEYTSRDQSNAKPGPLRKCVRVLVTALLERHIFKESKWINAVQGALLMVLDLPQTLVNVCELVGELLQESHQRHKAMGSGMVNIGSIIDVACLILFKYPATAEAAWQPSLCLFVATALEDYCNSQANNDHTAAELQKSVYKLMTVWRHQPTVFLLCVQLWTQQPIHSNPVTPSTTPSSTPTVVSGGLGAAASYIIALTAVTQFVSTPDCVKCLKAMPGMAEEGVATLSHNTHSVIIDRFVKLAFPATASTTSTPLQQQQLIAYVGHLRSYFGSLPAVYWDPSSATQTNTSNVSTATAASPVAEVGGLCGHVIKAMKKAPEKTAPLVSALLSQLGPQIDLSSFVSSGGAHTHALKLMFMASSTEYGRTMYQALCRQTHNAGVWVDCVLQTLLDALTQASGVASKATTPQHRASVYLCLLTAARAPHAQEAVAKVFFDKVFPACVAALERFEVGDNKDENARSLCATVIAVWTTEILKQQTHVGDTVIHAVATTLKIILTKATTPQTPALTQAQTTQTKQQLEVYLFVCVYILTHSAEAVTSLLSALQPLVPLLLNLVKEAHKRPTLAHSDAVMAASLLVKLSVHSAEVAQTCNSSAHKLWATLVGGTSASSFLLSKQLLTHTIKNGFDTTAAHALQPALAINSSRTDEQLAKLGSQSFSSALAQSLASIFTHPQAVSVALANTSQPAEASVWGAWIGLFDHPAVEVRTFVQAYTQLALAQSSLNLSKQLVTTLTQALRSWTVAKQTLESDILKSYKPTTSNQTDADSETKRVVSVRKQLSIPTPTVLQNMLLACLPSSVTSQDAGELQALCVYVCAHPLVTNHSHSKALQLWMRVNHKLLSADAAVSLSEEAIAAMGANVVALIQDTDGSKDDEHVLEMIALIVHSQQRQQLQSSSSSSNTPTTDTLVHSHLLPFFTQTLSLALTFPNLTQSDIATFLSPTEAINAFIQTHTVNIDDIKITNADRKKETSRGTRRGAFETDLSEDAEWADRIKKDKIAKLNAEAAGGSGTIQQRAVHEVETVCNKVRACAAVPQRVLRLLGSLCRAISSKANSLEAEALHVGAALVCELLPVVGELLGTSLLLTEPAYECVIGMCTLVHPLLTSNIRDLAASLRIVHDASKMSALIASHGEDSGPVQRLIQRLMHTRNQLFGASGTGNHRMEGTIHLLFPVLRDVLTQVPNKLVTTTQAQALTPTHMIRGTEPALQLLDKMWTSAVTVSSEVRQRLFVSVCETILVSLANYQTKIEPQPEDFLGRLVLSSLPLSTNEWTPLLGDLGVLSTDIRVRKACYRVLTAVFAQTANSAHSDRAHVLDWTPAFDAHLTTRLFMSVHDEEDDETKTLAASLWSMFSSSTGARLPVTFAELLSPYLSHPHVNVRTSAAKALAHGLNTHPVLAEQVIEQILTVYANNAPVVIEKALRVGATFTALDAPVVGKGVSTASVGKKASNDLFSPVGGGSGKQSTGKQASASALAGAGSAGKPIASAVTVEDHNFNTRAAVGHFVQAVGTSSCLSSSGQHADAQTHLIQRLFDFLLTHGVVDTNDSVRSQMITAGRALVDAYAPGDKTRCGLMLDQIQAVLAQTHNPAQPQTGGQSDSQSKTTKASAKGGKAQAPTPVQTQVPKLSEAELVASDNRHVAAVILLGAVGKHLDKADESIHTITDTLVQTLSVPSESVQLAVSDCLVPLVQVLKQITPASGDSSQPSHIHTLIHTLLARVTAPNTSYGERCGAALGLSACVKGVGIPALKSFDIVNTLRDVCMGDDKSTGAGSKQGALFAIECLSERLGLLFEPYIPTLMPVLLKSFSHASDHVRDAAHACAHTLMGKLSAHGVKQLLGPVLVSVSAQTETQWKSRMEAVRLLGTMAHCAPKQLAACLPQIVPKLVEVGSDPHPKVKEAAKAAMTDISAVIKNPEIAQLSPVLLAALADPANKTKDALDELLVCEFMHSIDAPSLALLVPILGRALRERAADLKRKSAAIAGNILSMSADPRALLPYLSILLPGIKQCVCDPIPDVRATSAKALGSLMTALMTPVSIAGSGTLGVCVCEELREVMPWLLQTLVSEVSPVERSGAAQAMSEVCVACDRVLQQQTSTQGLQTMQPTQEGVLSVPLILEQALPLQRSNRSAAREGLLWLLSFLPTTLHESFGTFIPTCLPIVLSGLCDESESVREVAMRAGQTLVHTLGHSHTLAILPSLQQGMFAEDYRIRHSSVVLLGEMLYLVGDTKAVGLAEGEGEEGYDITQAGGDAHTGVSGSVRAIVNIRVHVGEKMANSVFASLYIIRSDVASNVRQAALQVWKSIITNTPRTMVEIMSDLVSQIIDRLSAPGAAAASMEGTQYQTTSTLSAEAEELRYVAGKALGDIVRKLGDRVLPIIMPHLRKGQQSESVDMRQGVCVGLSEILASASSKQIEDYLHTHIVSCLQASLCDSAHSVRVSAARAFQTLFKAVGSVAVQEVVPALLGAIAGTGGEVGELALQGLREITNLRPRDLLEYLIPKLLTHPLQGIHARAFGAVVGVCSQQLNYHFSMLVPYFVTELMTIDAQVAASDGSSDSGDLQQRFELVKQCATSTMAATSVAGVTYLCTELGAQIEHESSVPRRRWGLWMTEQLLRSSKAVTDEFVCVFLKYILGRVAETDVAVQQAVIDALAALPTALPLDQLIYHVDFIRTTLSSTYSDAKHRYGSSLLSQSSTLPVFSLPKALDPLLTLYLHGLMNGSVPVRESSAGAIGELVTLTDAAALKPYLIKTTGPLIRVVGDKFPSSVKAAILKTICVLLDKGGVALKAFAPQLNTTFVKSLHDPSRQVRVSAISGLGKVMPLSLRIDPLITELCGYITGTGTNPANPEGTVTTSVAIRTSFIDALATVLTFGGDKCTPAGFDKVQQLIALYTNTAGASAGGGAGAGAGNINLQELEDEVVRAVLAKCCGALAMHAEARVVVNVLIDLLDMYKPAQLQSRSSSRSGSGAVSLAVLCVSSLLQCGGSSKVGPEQREEVFALLQAAWKDERAGVRVAAVEGLGLLLTFPSQLPNAEARRADVRANAVAALQTFAPALAQVASPSNATESGETRKAALFAIKQAAKYYTTACSKHLKLFLPALMAATSDMNLSLKYIADRALKYALDGGSQQAVAAFVGSYDTAASGASSSSSSSSAASDAAAIKFVKDYAKKVLVTLSNEDSDTEPDSKW